MKLFRINIISFRNWIMHLFLCLLIIFDLRTYLVTGSGISIITSGLIFFYLVCYLYLCVLYPKIYIRFFDVIVFLFLCIYGARVYVNIYIDGIYNTIFENNITYIVYFFLLAALPYQACRRIPFSKIHIETLLVILFVFYFLALIYSFSNVCIPATSWTSSWKLRRRKNENCIYGHPGLCRPLPGGPGGRRT